LNTDDLGRLGEETAESFLKEHGYRIVERNYSCRFGEIDIIGWDGDILCFMEVKTRNKADGAEPQEGVGLAKQRKLARAAVEYLKRRKLGDVDSRFDVVSVIIRAGGEADVTIFKNAFAPEGNYF